MCKLIRQLRQSGEEKSRVNTNFFHKGQQLELAKNVVGEKEHSADVELQEIDLVAWEKKTELWVVPQEIRLEVLRQNCDSRMAGQWERDRSRGLV